MAALALDQWRLHQLSASLLLGLRQREGDYQGIIVVVATAIAGSFDGGTRLPHYLTLLQINHPPRAVSA